MFQLIAVEVVINIKGRAHCNVYAEERRINITEGNH